MGVPQAPQFTGDNYALVLGFQSFLDDLQAFCAFPHVPYSRHWVDLLQVPGICLYNNQDSFIDSPCCCDDEVAVRRAISAVAFRYMIAIISSWHLSWQ